MKSWWEGPRSEKAGLWRRALPPSSPSRAGYCKWVYQGLNSTSGFNFPTSAPPLLRVREGFLLDGTAGRTQENKCFQDSCEAPYPPSAPCLPACLAWPWQIHPVKTILQPEPLALQSLPRLPPSPAVCTFPIKALPLDYRRMLHPNRLLGIKVLLR